jgi:hypothetical protein
MKTPYRLPLFSLARLLPAMAVLFLPEVALAWNQQGSAMTHAYYIYGGFDAISNAFTKVALISSDSNYSGLMFTVITVSLALHVMVTITRLFFGGGGSARDPDYKVNAFLPGLVGWGIGVAIFTGLVMAQGTIVLYDNLENKTATIAGIPVIDVIAAGVTNSLENAFVDMVTTSGDPIGYKAQAGGKGYLGLYRTMSQPLTSQDTGLDTSMANYINQCVVGEMALPGTTLTTDELRKTSPNLLTTLGKAASPALYTDVYDPGFATNPQNLDCNTAWGNLLPRLNKDANFTGNFTAACSEMGFDPSDPNAYNQCLTTVNGVIQNIGGPYASLVSTDFIRQAYVAQGLENALRIGDSQASASYNVGMQATGSMQSFNEWCPWIRAAILSISLTILPFLAMLIPTPLLKPAMKYIIGTFLFLTVWGVVDATMHQFVTDFGNKVFYQVTQNGLGMDALFFMPTSTVKILSMFGIMRASSMAVALTITTGVFGLSNAIAGSAAGAAAASAITGTGVAAERQVGSPSERGSAIQGNMSGMVAEDMANNHSYKDRYGSNIASAEKNLGSGSIFNGNRGLAHQAGGAVERGLLENRAVWAQHQTQSGMTFNETGFQGARTFSSGDIKFTTNQQGDKLQAVSGGKVHVSDSEAIRAAFATAINNADSDASRYSTAVGTNLSRALTRSDGNVSTEALTQSFSKGSQAAYTVQKGVQQMAVEAVNKSQGLVDEHGTAVRKEDALAFIASAKAGTPFGSVAPVSVSISGNGTHTVSVGTDDSNKHTFTFQVSDQKALNKSTGKTWADTVTTLKQLQMSESDQRSRQELLTLTDNENVSEQTEQAWGRVATLQASQSREESKAASSTTDYDTAFYRAYGDAHYADLPPMDRYMNAVADINNMAVNGGAEGKEKLDALKKDFILNNGLAPVSEDKGLAKPGESPVDLTNVPAAAKSERENLTGAYNGMNVPEAVPVNLRQKISASKASFGLAGPNERQYQNYFSLMTDNASMAGNEMLRVTSSMFPVARFAPGMPLYAPTAKGASEGRIPDNSLSDIHLVNPMSAPGPLNSVLTATQNKFSLLGGELSTIGSGKPFTIAGGHAVPAVPGGMDRLTNEATGYVGTYPNGVTKDMLGAGPGPGPAKAPDDGRHVKEGMGPSTAYPNSGKR